jgi:transcriptional regulator with XRE-family HTH domain
MNEKLSSSERKRLSSQGERLRLIREGKGLSQVKLAKKLTLSTTAIQNWERGANDILYKHRDNLCNALGCTFSEISGDNISHSNEEKTIETLEKEVASAVLNAPQEVQDVIQALIIRYQNDEQDGAETARAIKKLLGI